MKLLVLIIAALCMQACMGVDEIDSAPPGPQPNQPPRIDSVHPAEHIVHLKAGQNLEFQVLGIYDDERLGFGYRWQLGEDVIGYSQKQPVNAIIPGLHTLTVIVWDCPGVTNFDEVAACELEALPDSLSDSHTWILSVEP